MLFPEVAVADVDGFGIEMMVYDLCCRCESRTKYPQTVTEDWISRRGEGNICCYRIVVVSDTAIKGLWFHLRFPEGVPR